MLLEISCTVDHFMEFLNRAEDAGIKPDFDMHGADVNSGFGSIAQGENEVVIETSGSEDAGVVEEKEDTTDSDFES